MHLQPMLPDIPPRVRLCDPNVHEHIHRVTLKMHDLKMTDKENYGSGKFKTGK